MVDVLLTKTAFREASTRYVAVVANALQCVSFGDDPALSETITED